VPPQAVVFGLVNGLFSVKAGAFRGGTDSNNQSAVVDTGVFSLEVAPIEGVNFGVSYVTDLAESDAGIAVDDGTEETSTAYSSDVPGLGVYLSAHYRSFALEAEYVSALDDFDGAMAGVNDRLTGTRPSVWNLELAWLPDGDWLVAARLEGGNDFADNLTRYGLAGSYGFWEDTVLAIEYLRLDADANANDAHSVTVQLAVEL